MNVNDTTRLDQNMKRVNVGSIVTVANPSINKRQHYYISDGDTHPSLSTHEKVDVVTADTPIAKALMGKMLGDKIFFRHNLVIEYIEWPGNERMARE